MRCNSMFRLLPCKLVLPSFAAVILMLLSITAQADVLVSPLRVHLDESNQTAAVIVRNPSDGPRTYRLEWIEQRMTEEGTYIKYKEGEEVQHRPASPYLRVSPRQVTVPARSNQSVRVNYRPASNMAPGEYRSHLLFSVIPELSNPLSVQTIDKGDGITLELSMQLSIAIPVVVTHQLDEMPQVTIAEVEPLPASALGQSAQLAVVIQRSGLGGSFGKVVVDMQVDSEAPVERIGMADNISVYAEMDQRRLVLKLRDQQIPTGAWLRVAYEGAAEYKGVLWAEQVFQTR